MSDENEVDVGDLPPESRVSFPGPFSQHDVVVSGWRVPLVHAQVHDAGRLTITLDNRFGLELSVAEAERVVPFLANAIAVALGYESHPSAGDSMALSRSQHPKPQPVMSVAGFGVGSAP
jgi:hypothetical protein